MIANSGLEYSMAVKRLTPTEGRQDVSMEVPKTAEPTEAGPPGRAGGGTGPLNSLTSV